MSHGQTSQTTWLKGMETAPKYGRLLRLKSGDKEAIGYWSSVSNQWIVWRPGRDADKKPKEALDWEPTEWAPYAMRSPRGSD
jgi:hypothetical protein